MGSYWPFADGSGESVKQNVAVQDISVIVTSWSPRELAFLIWCFSKGISAVDYERKCKESAGHETCMVREDIAWSLPGEIPFSLLLFSLLSSPLLLSCLLAQRNERAAKAGTVFFLHDSCHLARNRRKGPAKRTVGR